jgi:hypothetical protein
MTPANRIEVRKGNKEVRTEGRKRRENREVGKGERIGKQANGARVPGTWQRRSCREWCRSWRGGAKE